MNNTLTQPNSNIQTVSLMNASQAVNSVLNQYGYTLSYGDTERLKSLQPGQSMTVYATAGAQGGALLKVTYYGNGQYQIESLTPLKVNNQWIDINQAVSTPTAAITYSNGNVQSVTTTGYSTTGTVVVRESGIPGSTALATYNVSVSAPVTSQITNTSIQFSSGTPQTSINLQSINVPTITSQQLQALQSGQNLNIKPGWYYNPETNEFIKIGYKTITQPQTNLNNLWFGYSSQPTNQQTQILQYSFSNISTPNYLINYNN
jgi:hypothetical protein